MVKKLKQIPQVGRKFVRPDLERCDLFIDMGFPEWGQNNTKIVETSKVSKLPQISSGVPSGGRKKCGLQKLSGYFDQEFTSIFVGDPYIEKWKTTGRAPVQTRAGPWIPAHATELQSTPGDYYGTFVKHMDAFSPLKKAFVGKKKPELRNILTNPSKKGNAGYADIGINKYPPHSVDGIVDTYPPGKQLYAENWKRHKAGILNGPFISSCYPRYFDENPYRTLTSGPEYVRPVEKVYGIRGPVFYPPATPKMPGNNHDGCFSKFPEWMPEPYRTVKDSQKLLNSSYSNQSQASIWRPEPRLKRYYTVSVVNNKIDIACNERTWRTMKPITYPQFNL